MKIALVLIGNSNLGNNLTNFALYSLVRKLCPNDEVVAINAPREYYSDYYGCDLFCLFKYTNDFSAHNVNRGDELENIGKQYDIYICGSDQIWRLGFATLTNMYPYMDWVDSKKKKISYSTSFGIEHYEGNHDDTWLASKFIERFDHISVRESSGIDIINNTFMVDKKVECVLDPVLLLDDCVIEELLNRSNYSDDSNYIAAYLWEKDNVRAVKNINKLFNNFNNVIINVRVMADFKFDSDSDELCVEDWLKIIKESELLVTDSFHGVCASIILKKDFYFIKTDNPRGFTRIYDLLNKLDLTDRIIKKDDVVIRKNIDYTKVNAKLSLLQYSGINWLKRSIYSNDDNKAEDELFLNLYKDRLRSKKTNNDRFKDLLEWIKAHYESFSEIAVWGVSDIFARNYKEIKSQLGVTKVFDNDKEKWGNKYFGLTCYCPEDLNSQIVVLILLEPIRFNYDIEKQLMKKGITKVLSYNTITGLIGRI